MRGVVALGRKHRMKIMADFIGETGCRDHRKLRNPTSAYPGINHIHLTENIFSAKNRRQLH